ncbi:serine protease family S33 [Achlya hypogyna]|uniref:Serine protease family S33 n=1 Tax=Achlya hypogyna TaxID=1202772 RepID=A0A1V9ZLW3_ACHHY|nr:serine protease family S33 [Achlya hypogyna]
MWKPVVFGVASVVAVPLLLLWGAIGWLLTRPTIVAATASVIVVLALAIAAYVQDHVMLFDFPAALAAAFGLLLLCPRKTLYNLPLFVAFFSFAIARRICLSSPPMALANWITVLSCVGLVWGYTCALRLWIPANFDALASIEDMLYKSHIMSDYKLLKIGGLGTVHVPYCGVTDESRLPPLNLVLVHGYAAGNAFWATNLQTLAKQYNVYAVEWQGIGRSDRPDPNFKTYEEADAFFVDAIERWRKEVQLEQFVLAGHSMGGIFVTHYAVKYPQRVEQLILISPAGVGYPPKEAHAPKSLFFRVVHLGWKSEITPMALVRFFGPFGPKLVSWILQRRMNWLPETSVLKSGILDNALIAEYMYHNWALKKSGDVAMNTHLLPGAYGKRALRDKLLPGQVKMPVTFIYGGGSDWMDFNHGQDVVDRLKATQYASLRKVPLAGHQVFMDNSAAFNAVLIEAITDGLQLEPFRT